jgi:hypothetical protein
MAGRIQDDDVWFVRALCDASSESTVTWVVRSLRTAERAAYSLAQQRTAYDAGAEAGPLVADGARPGLQTDEAEYNLVDWREVSGAKFNIPLRSSSGDTNEKGNNDIVVKYKASKGMT